MSYPKSPHKKAQIRQDNISVLIRLLCKVTLLSENLICIIPISCPWIVKRLLKCLSKRKRFIITTAVQCKQEIAQKASRGNLSQENVAIEKDNTYKLMLMTKSKPKQQFSTSMKYKQMVSCDIFSLQVVMKTGSNAKL